MKYMMLAMLMCVGCGNDGAQGPGGAVGNQGPAGPQGAAGQNFTASYVKHAIPSSTACVALTGYSLKKKSASANTANLYTGTTCAGSAVVTLNAANNEVYSTGAYIFVLEGKNSTGITLTQYSF